MAHVLELLSSDTLLKLPLPARLHKPGASEGRPKHSLHSVTPDEKAAAMYSFPEVDGLEEASAGTKVHFAYTKEPDIDPNPCMRAVE